jgi:hypothetical protein
VATFIWHDDRRIAFKKTGGERTGGIILLGFGALFAGRPITWLSRAAPPDMYAILFLILFALVGVLICGWGLFPTLTSEWLVIDLSRGIYRGRRGVLFWHERLDGPLDDFEEVRIVDVPS